MVIDTDQYVTARQAQRKLGISRQSFYRVAARRGWYYLKVYGLRLYHRADVSAYKPIVGHPIADQGKQAQVIEDDTEHWLE